MPSLANGNGNAKFQLPVLDFKFGSLTDGTDIPPPLPSPIEEEPSELPKTPQLQAQEKANANANGTQTSPETMRSSLKRSADEAAPGSPSSSKGQPSIRRLFSRIRLDSMYTNGDSKIGESLLPKGSDSRPNSQGNASTKQSKRSSGFFRRLRGSDNAENKRASRMFPTTENVKPIVVSPPKPTGPPPPMIPDFKTLGSKVDVADDGGSLGDDLFKNIS